MESLFSIICLFRFTSLSSLENTSFEKGENKTKPIGLCNGSCVSVLQ